MYSNQWPAILLMTTCSKAPPLKNHPYGYSLWWLCFKWLPIKLHCCLQWCLWYKHVLLTLDVMQFAAYHVFQAYLLLGLLIQAQLSFTTIVLICWCCFKGLHIRLYKCAIYQTHITVVLILVWHLSQFACWK